MIDERSSRSHTVVRRGVGSCGTPFSAKSPPPLTRVASTLSYPFHLSTPPCASSTLASNSFIRVPRCHRGSGFSSRRSGSTANDEVSDGDLHRLVALIQRRGLHLDHALIGARPEGSYLEHLDLEMQSIVRSYGLGQRNSSNPTPTMRPTGLSSLSTSRRMVIAAVCHARRQALEH
jgi:hypothetical protein